MDQMQTPDVHLVDNSGNIGLMPQDQALDAVRSGQFRIATPNEINDLQMQQKYGEGHATEAFLAGAARGATFGASDVLATEMGIASPEKLRELEKQHSVASPLGEATGVLGSLLIPGVGEAQAEVAPAKIASKVAQGITEKALPLAERAATKIVNPETSPIVHKILSQAGSHAIGSAVEGALYGAGKTVSEEALGDPELNGEKILSNVGLSALFGGALGATFAAGAEALPPVINKARESLGKVADVAKKAGQETYATLSGAISGKDPELIRRAFSQIEDINKTLPEKEALVRDFAENLEKQYNDISKASMTTSSKIRPLENQHLLQDMDPAKAIDEFNNIQSRIDDVITKLRSEPEIYPQSFARKVENYRNSMIDNLTKRGQWNAADAYEAINQFKKDIDPILKFEKKAGISEADAIGVLKGLRSEIKSSLEDAGTWGESAISQSAFNDAVTEHLYAEKMFQKSFMKKVPRLRGGTEYVMDPSKVRSFFRNINNETGAERSEILSEYLSKSEDLLNSIEKRYQNVPDKVFDKDSIARLLEKNKIISSEAEKQASLQNTLGQLGAGKHNTGLGEAAALGIGYHNPALGAAVEAFNMLNNPALAMQRLSTLDSLARKVTYSIDKATGKMFKFGYETSEKLTGLAASKLSEREKSHDDLPKTVAAIKDLSANPDKFLATMEKNVGPVSKYAPNISQNITMKAGAAIEFLQSKIPQLPQQKPFSKPYQLSPAEVYKFERYYNVVKDPMIAFEQIKNGSITSETIETLSAVYPKLYQEMKEKTFESLLKYGKKNDILPYQMKMSLSLFLGEPMDDSLSAESIADNQAVFAKLYGGGIVNQPRSSIKGLDKLNVSNRWETETQKIASRKESES